MAGPQILKRKGQQGGITAAKVRELYDEGNKATRTESRNYWVNRCFVAGEMNIRWDDWRNRPDSLPASAPNRTKHVNNRLWPSSRTLISKMLRRPLQFEVLATQPNDDAVLGARIAEAAVEDVHREHDWEDLRRDHAWAMWLGGTAGLALEWDPRAGELLEENHHGGRVGTGDTREYALNVTEIVTEPGARNIEKAAWWIRLAALPPGEVRDLYGLEDEPKSDASAGLSPLQARLLEDRGEEASSSLTLVLTYYERPTGKSEGQVAVVVGEEVVSHGAWPFPFKDRLNICVARETPVGGRWTGDTILSAAISPQRALNRAEGSIDEHMDKAGNARILDEDGTTDDEAWDDDPASIVHVRPGAQKWPDYMSPPQMPSWWQARPGEIKADIDDILGVHDISRGDAPSGVDSGVALSLLAEQDDTPVGAVAAELASCWGRFATIVLRTLEAKVTERRPARIERSGQLPEVVSWSGGDFAGQTRCIVPLDAVAPTSRAARLQQGILLWDKGLFAGPDGKPDTQAFFSFVDVSGSNDVTSHMNADAAKAQRENHQMALGIPAVPERFDNHEIHIAEIDRFRKSERYEHSSEDVKAIFEDHANAHEVLGHEEAGEQQNRAMVNPALPGAPQAHEPAAGGEDLMVPPPELLAQMAAQGGPQGQPVEQSVDQAGPPVPGPVGP